MLKPNIEEECKNVNYVEDPHNYILSQYNERCDCKPLEKVVIENKSQYIVDGKLDINKFSDFFCNNIALFADTLLYSQIVDEALIKYDIPFSYKSEIDIPFTYEYNKKYLDYKKQFNGYNFLKVTTNSLINELGEFCRNEIIVNMDKSECKNFDTLFQSMVNGDSYSDTYDILKIAQSDTTFSKSYQSFLSFSINNNNFYTNNPPNINNKALPTFVDNCSYFLKYNYYKNECYDCTPSIGTFDEITHRSLASAGAAANSDLIRIFSELELIFNLLLLL